MNDITLTSQQVLEFLKENPTFFEKHPEALASLLPEDGELGGNVVDFQHYAIQALQKRVEDTKEHFSSVVNVARDNHRMQQQVQDATLRLMGVHTLEQLFECLCLDFPVVFDVDVVRLALESDMGGQYESYYPEQHYSGMALIEIGAVERLFPKGKTVHLIAESTLDAIWITEQVFHECQDFARSIAYMALNLEKTGRQALLSFGVREAGRFQAGQGTELLSYLAKVTALKLDHLLYEQAGLL